MGVGPRIVADCYTDDCRWETDTHVTDVRKFGVECIIHLDQYPHHEIHLERRDG